MLCLTVVGLLSACDSCDPDIGEVVGDESITLDLGGGDLSELLIYVDITGGEDPTPPLEKLETPPENGRVGPIMFTERFMDPISTEANGIGLENTRHAFDYFIRKNPTSDAQVLRVEFFLEAGKCSTTWTYIRYFLNAQLLDDLTNQQQVTISIP